MRAAVVSVPGQAPALAGGLVVLILLGFALLRPRVDAAPMPG